MGVKIDSKFRCDISYSEDFSVMKVAVINRENDEVLESGEFDGRKVAAALRPQVYAQGLNKKLMSDTSDVSPGPGKVAALGEVYGRLVAGNWTAERTRGVPTVSAEVEGIAEAIKQPVSAVQKARSTTSDEVWASLVAKYADAIAAVRKRREGAAEGIDLATFA